MTQLTTYTVSDIYNWVKDKSLEVNPDFQRRNNWPLSSKRYLIDTILRGLPIPPIYVRTVSDPRTKTQYREVVDGQQRIRTIREFMDGEIRLSKESNEFSSLSYSDLEDDVQRAFMSYLIPVQQLFDADDKTVLSIFNRLNAYGLSLNQQEIRHGKFQGGRYHGAFRWAAIQASDRWTVLWAEYGVVSKRQWVRMADDELVAQMLGVLLEGVKDGGQPYINRLYESYDDGMPEGTEANLDSVVDFIIKNFSEVLRTRLAGSPHFLMLFAAVAHALVGLSVGDMGDPNPSMPEREDHALRNLAVARSNLMALSEVLEFAEERVPKRFVPFKIASAGTTQRIRSRSRRFVELYRSLLPEDV